MFNQADFIGWAKQLVRAQEIIDQADRLSPTVVKLEERKKTLSAEVADLLAKTETHRKNGAALIRELEDQRAQLTTSVETLKESIAADKAAQQEQALRAAADHEAIKNARVGQLSDAINSLRREIADLTKKRDGLKAEIDTTLAKYR